MTQLEYVFGIDGGGSGCRVAVCERDGRRLVETTGGPANFTTDRDGAIQNVLDAIHSAKVQLPTDDVNLKKCAAHIGLAGIMEESGAHIVAAGMPFARVTVSDDRATSVAGALAASDGVVVSVGTGSFVAAQRCGIQRFIGGWGLMLGDEASGAWLGHQALRRAVLAAEGLLPQTDLMQDLVQEHGGTLHGLLSFVNAAQPHDYAALAPRVIEAAQSADLHGLALMREGAQYLGSCLQELKIMEHDRLCLIGGVGPYYTPYLDVEVTPLIQPPKGGALDGAVHLARQLL